LQAKLVKLSPNIDSIKISVCVEQSVNFGADAYQKGQLGCSSGCLSLWFYGGVRDAGVRNHRACLLNYCRFEFACLLFRMSKHRPALCVRRWIMWHEIQLISMERRFVFAHRQFGQPFKLFALLLLLRRQLDE
jgi:hypothetical protein